MPKNKTPLTPTQLHSFLTMKQNLLSQKALGDFDCYYGEFSFVLAICGGIHFFRDVEENPKKLLKYVKDHITPSFSAHKIDFKLNKQFEVSRGSGGVDVYYVIQVVVHNNVQQELPLP